MKFDLKKGWNKISEKYQKYTKISLKDVHYGPLAEGEKKLKLLGNVKGRKILEVGCGGGQNSVVLSKWGGKVTGIDLSPMQIAYAKKLAIKGGVKVKFHVGNANNLSRFFKKNEFDIVISSFAFQYFKDLKKPFKEISKVLKKNGIFVFCTNHPLTYHKFTSKGILIKDYFKPKISTWCWEFPDRTKVRFLDFYHKFEDYFYALRTSGFLVEAVIEQKTLSKNKLKKAPYIPYNYLQEIKKWQKIPFTLLIKARKVK